MLLYDFTANSSLLPDNKDPHENPPKPPRRLSRPSESDCRKPDDAAQSPTHNEADFVSLKSIKCPFCDETVPIDSWKAHLDTCDFVGGS